MARHRKHNRHSGGWQRFIWIGVGIALVAASGIGIAVFAGRSGGDALHGSNTATSRSASPLPVVEVHKDPTCGCCSKWVDHLQAHGFTVATKDTTDMAAFKTSHGVPRRVQSCHTALVDGYVVEGHVPATDVQQLLKERPPIAGLAVGGMPVGSPGMEISGVKAQRYDVMAFGKDGETRVFATHN